MRNNCCPICQSETDEILRIRMKAKMHLPQNFAIRSCELDSFLFVAAGSSKDYDEYYTSIANDTYHSELAAGGLHSPIAVCQTSMLSERLHGFFEKPKKIFDFGCGEASLLCELAAEFPDSEFRGFDPSPAAQIGSQRARSLNLRNLRITDFQTCSSDGPYDLVIVSHVLEHLIDFDLLNSIKALVADDGLLYIEVPDAVKYSEYQRKEFLYYFDRLHVNHFTPQSLNNLLGRYGFSHRASYRYSFPYRDGGEYPALGMIFAKRGISTKLTSEDIRVATENYITQEKRRAQRLRQQFEAFEGVLVWGAGDNFCRSLENEGPLSGLPKIVLLDSKPQTITIGKLHFEPVPPQEGLAQFAWPVIITVSEARERIVELVAQKDPSRALFTI